MVERDRSSGEDRPQPTPTHSHTRSIGPAGGPLAPLGPLASVALVLVAVLALREMAKIVVPIVSCLTSGLSTPGVNVTLARCAGAPVRRPQPTNA